MERFFDLGPSAGPRGQNALRVAGRRPQMIRRRLFPAVLVFSGLATTPAIVVASHSADRAEATVCVNAGRRISVSGCSNIADNIERYVPPPAAYAPLPEDDAPPPPPPP
jgi:hypothetical protein